MTDNRNASILTRTFNEPGRGMRVQTFLLIKGKDAAETQKIADEAGGKLRKKESVQSSEYPGCIEIHGLASESPLDTALANATVVIKSLNDADPLPETGL